MGFCFLRLRSSVSSLLSHLSKEFPCILPHPRYQKKKKKNSFLYFEESTAAAATATAIFILHATGGCYCGLFVFCFLNP